MNYAFRGSHSYYVFRGSYSHYDLFYVIYLSI